MKRFLFALALVCPFQAMAAPAPGLITEQITAAHHGRAMDIAIWYPGSGGAEQLFADNPVFQGGLVMKDATLTPGKHPVVLLSHGMGGSYLSLNWLASGLAERGAIVISVNHPNGWFKDRNIDKMFDHWTRVADLRTALDAVLADKRFAGQIDESRIYATGFSFGGWTALSLGGTTTSPAGNAAYCSAAAERSHNCTDLKAFGLDPAKANTVMWRASYKDPRVKAVAAIDPGLTWDMKADDVGGLEQEKLLLIGLGRGADRLYATDTTRLGSNFERLVPKARVEVLEPANHFTAMPICKAAGEAILAEEKDDPVCTDPAGGNRQAVHDEIIDLISQHFGL